MRTLSRKSFAIGLLVALLVVYTGRAVPVSALAELAPEVAPVFDTQIYQLQDYIDHGGITDPQLDVFYVLCGLYALGQAGSENYTLTNPYATQSGVLNWLKDVGIETYNTLISLAPDTVRLPDGSILSTDLTKRALSTYVANLMGCAITATQYTDLSDFEDDVEESDNFYIPWNSKAQYGLNTMFQTFGGIYNWQFQTQPWTSNFSWYQSNLTSSQQSSWNTLAATLTQPYIYCNPQYPAYATNMITTNFPKMDLFIRTDTPIAYFVDSNGNKHNDVTDIYSVMYRPDWSLSRRNTCKYYFREFNYSSLTYDNLLDLARQLLNTATVTRNPTLINVFFDEGSNWSSPDYAQLVNKIYAGTSWATRSEIQNLIDLNINDDGKPYYVAPPEETNYLLDIKGILQDILNNTNLYNVFINNLYTPDGLLVHDTDLIRISVELLDYYQEQNPPIPVNLNDIEEYTDNTYLERLKEHARNFGDTFAAYVAFWHNADHDLVYTIFGAAIMVLIGAFIGKWGHS